MDIMHNIVALDRSPPINYLSTTASKHGQLYARWEQVSILPGKTSPLIGHMYIFSVVITNEVDI